MGFTVTKDLTAADEAAFVELFCSQVAQLYPFSSALTARSFIKSHHQELDPFGYFTKRKRIWKAIADGDRVGFTVATEKRGGSIKFGPTIIDPERQGQGLGALLRGGVETHYAADGYRKAYSTTNLKNLAGIFYLTKIGYQIELHLKDHYAVGKDEVVLSRLLTEAVAPVNQNEPIAGLADYERRLFDDLAPDFGEIDAVFFEHVRKSIKPKMRWTEQAFANKTRLLFRDEANECVALAVPKRGSCVKVMPFAASKRKSANRDVFEQLRRAFVGHAHKLYTFVPTRRPTKVSALEELGFRIEGFMQMPYKSGVNVYAMSARIDH